MSKLDRSLESVWLEVGGYNLHARVSRTCRSGRGRSAVVLVHGLGVSSRYMIPLAHTLALDFDVYAPDLPGFGRSEKPCHVLTIEELADILALFMDELELDRAVLVGNSLGCEIVTEFGIHHSERVRRAVLLGPTIDSARRTTREQVMRLALDAWLEPFSLIPIVIYDYIIAGPRRIVRTFQYMLNHRMEERMPRLEFPVLVVRGARDPVVTQRWVEEVQQLLPQGRLVVLPGVAHAINYSAPGHLHELILSFDRE